VSATSGAWPSAYSNRQTNEQPKYTCTWNSINFLSIFYTLSFDLFPRTCCRAFLQSSHSSCDWLSANSDQPITRRLRSVATPQWTVMQLANKVGKDSRVRAATCRITAYTWQLYMKKHTAPKQNIKNDTCIEFSRDIKALTLLADTTSSGNLFRSLTTRTRT